MNTIRLAVSSTIFMSFLLANFSCKAQNENYIHYGGVGAMSTSDFSGGGELAVYNPRYVLKQLSDKTTLNVTSYLGFTRSRTELDPASPFYGRQVSTGFAVDIPVLIQLDFGRHSNYEANNRLGAFVGSGIGYSAYLDGDTESGIGSTFGLVTTAGFRFKMLRQDYALRGSYTLAISGDNMYGVSILYGLNRNEDIREKRTRSNRRSSGYQFQRGERWNGSKMKLSNMFGTNDRSMNRRMKQF